MIKLFSVKVRQSFCAQYLKVPQSAWRATHLAVDSLPGDELFETPSL